MGCLRRVGMAPKSCWRWSAGWFEGDGVVVSGFEFDGGGADDFLAWWRDELVFSGCGCSQDGFVEIAVAPLEVDFEAAAGA